MKRMCLIMAAPFLALLAVIAGLSIALRKERQRKCIPIPEVPQQVRRKMADLAALATDTAAEIDSLATRGIKGARSVADRAVHVLR
jgi:hypothetical protein